MDWQRPITLGHVSGLFGVRGWVKVHSYTRPAANILALPYWHIGTAGQRNRFRVCDGRRQSKTLIAQLADESSDVPITDRDTVVRLVGRPIDVPREVMPTLPAGQHYWFDLVGMSVVDLDDTRLGRVRQLMETGGANDVLVVADGDHERLIPFLIDRVVKEVDYAEDRIVVDWDPDF